MAGGPPPKGDPWWQSPAGLAFLDGLAKARAKMIANFARKKAERAANPPPPEPPKPKRGKKPPPLIRVPKPRPEPLKGFIEPDPKPRPFTPRQRTCICCDAPFTSTSVGHRMCGPCKRSEIARYSTD